MKCYLRVHILKRSQYPDPQPLTGLTPMAATVASPTPPPPPVDACDVAIFDPPPPYPSRERRSGTVRPSRGRCGRIQRNHDVRIPYVDENTAARESDETTPILSTRPRTYSHTSTISAVPSLAHTVFSLFQFESDDGVYLHDGAEDRRVLTTLNDGGSLSVPPSLSTGFFSSAALKRYFRPLIRKSYYAALFHLMVVNFPYALAAWVYLFVFTVVRCYLAGSNHNLMLIFQKDRNHPPRYVTFRRGLVLL